MNMQAVISAFYPPRCLGCGELVANDFGLCASCWRDTPFITGLVCHKCGVPLAGDPADAGPDTLCDECLIHPRPWDSGRAAMRYAGKGRKLVLALKHGDRMDLGRAGAEWLFRAAQPILATDTLIVPIPLHWWRLFRRRYNQSALLTASLARLAGLDHCPDALVRRRYTGTQDGHGREGRFYNMEGAIIPHPRRGARMAGRDVLIVDDVLTSGATFAAATAACRKAGARQVSVLCLARVAKDDEIPIIG